MLTLLCHQAVYAVFDLDVETHLLRDTRLLLHTDIDTALWYEDAMWSRQKQRMGETRPCWHQSIW